jgi:hypothetical protein
MHRTSSASASFQEVDARKVMHPDLIVDAIGRLHEQHQLRCAKAELVIGSASPLATEPARLLLNMLGNIRAAAVLGVVGAGGLGQMLSFHMGLFQMQKTATVLIAMLLLVALVDVISFAWRRGLTR